MDGKLSVQFLEICDGVIKELHTMIDVVFFAYPFVF